MARLGDSLSRIAGILHLSLDAQPPAAGTADGTVALRQAMEQLRQALAECPLLARFEQHAEAAATGAEPRERATAWVKIDRAVQQALDACSDVAFDAVARLDPHKAAALRQAGWSMDAARQISSEAVARLVEVAVRTTGCAWRAEHEANVALRQAVAVLAKELPHGRSSGLNAVRLQALDMDLVGLAFSGGGIRSASFGLGVLQGLGKMRLLRIFDYFSTVSGGGYVGSWLAAWVRREGSLGNVEKQLDPDRVEQARAKRTVKEREDRADSLATPLRNEAVDEEPEPISHLRAYSRYLAPRPGLFSADSWTLGAIYLRNLLVNVVCLLPWCLAVILLTRLLTWSFSINVEANGSAAHNSVGVVFAFCAGLLCVWLYHQRTRLREVVDKPNAHPEGADKVIAGFGSSLAGACCAGGIAAIILFWGNFIVVGAAFLVAAVAVAIRMCWEPKRNQSDPAVRKSDPATTRTGIVLISAILLFVTTTLWLFGFCPPAGESHPLSEAEAIERNLPLRHPGYEWIHRDSPFKRWPGWVTVTISFGAGMALLSLLALGVRSMRPTGGGLPAKHLWALFLCDVTLGLGVGGFLYLALRYVIWPLGTDSAAIITFGPPALLVALVLADYVEILLLSTCILDEFEREWRSRLGAFLFMFATAWLVFFATTLYLPWSIQQLHNYPKTRAWVVATAGTAWGTLSALGAWAGRWLPADKGESSRPVLLRVLALVGPPVFLVGLLAAVSALVFVLPGVTAADWLDRARDASGWAACAWSVSLGISVGLAILFAYIVDVNLFSVHLLYANRLTRCYLGASQRKPGWRERTRGPFLQRDQNRRWEWDGGAGGGGVPTNADPKRIARREPTFSGFDPADDLMLYQLQMVRPTTDGAPDVPSEPDGGYRGPYPLFNTALNLVGGKELALQDRKAADFVLTPDFCGGKTTGYARVNKGCPLTLGRAMAISGAAVDPNMGAFASPALTALMTVFNTRLGWWLQNPVVWQDKWTGKGPGASYLLLAELFGQTTADHPYIHLSDGGHFENLGVYELIRRRCRFIVVTDAGTDRHASSDNLANLVRLVRTDFGIRIELDTAQLAADKDGLSRWHCAIGLIRYDDVDPQAVAGTLVYLCATLTGDESPDLRQYADTHSSFPHDTTLNQFFDEAQLESYRALGCHVAEMVFARAVRGMDETSYASMTIRAAIRQLFSDVRRHWFPPPPGADKQFLTADKYAMQVSTALRADSMSRLSEDLYPEAHGLVRGHAAVNPELHMVNEMLRVMETAWFAMKLGGYHAHPINRGWMNLFRRWTMSETFHRYWPFLRAEYSRDFVSFCEQTLNMVPTDVQSHRLDSPAAAAQWLGHIISMDREFAQEWATEAQRLDWLITGRYISDSVARAATSVPNGIRPLVWMLSLRDGRAVAGQPCGLVCAAPVSRGVGTDRELLVWLRGPYRNLGIGRKCLGLILREFFAELHPQPRLLAYYPDGEGSLADRLERAMWKNFFFDFGFRSLGRDQSGSLPGVSAVARVALS
jgi:hypothetical protein